MERGWSVGRDGPEGVNRSEKSYGNQKISGAESCVVEGTWRAGKGVRRNKGSTSMLIPYANAGYGAAREDSAWRYVGKTNSAARTRADFSLSACLSPK